MATIFINPTETNSLNFKKIQKNSNLKSLWAFLLSLLLLYFSVFYAFNLISTSNLVCTTKFWFFISNTIIFIIAADFGAFSSSKEADFYQEYVMKATDRVPFPFQPQHPKNVVNTTANAPKQEDYQKPREKIINMICTTTTKNDDRIEIHHEPEENKPPHVTFVVQENANMGENLDTKEQEISIPQVIIKKEGRHALKKRPKAASFRSNSATEIIPKMDVKRTLFAGHEEPPRCEENDEYSRMSDEELNRRVEEFIRGFNRQIRLQASNSPQI